MKFIFTGHFCCSKTPNLQLREQSGATRAPHSAGAMVSGFAFSAALCLALVAAEEEMTLSPQEWDRAFVIPTHVKTFDYIIVGIPGLDDGRSRQSWANGEWVGDFGGFKPELILRVWGIIGKREV